MESQLRVVHLALLRFGSALAWNAVTMGKALQERGHACWFGGQEGTPVLERAEREGISVPPELRLPELRPWNWTRAVGRLRHFLKRHRIDAIVVHTGSGHLEAHLARRGLNIPLVRVRCEARPPRPDLAHRWLYQRGTDCLVVSGAYMLDRHMKPIGIKTDRAVVIPPGIDLNDPAWRPETGRRQARQEIRQRFQIPPGVPLIGTIGRLSPVKGHRVMIEAAGLLAARGRDFRLLIVGEEKEVPVEELRALGTQLGIEERVIFAGFVEDPLLYASAFDLGVIPSLGSEALSRSALEFMAVGVPVIASLVGLLPEMVDEDELLVPPGRPEPLAEAMNRLIDDLAWAGRLGERSFKRVQEQFSLERLGERMEELLFELIAQRRRGGRESVKRHEPAAADRGDPHHAE
ncbi:MAG: glycosyltransferase family 4 protein [Candidatus Eisenbacteria bacterium]